MLTSVDSIPGAPARDTSADDALEALVGDIDGLRPHTGWSNIQQLPHLKDTQLAVCLRAHPEALDDLQLDSDDIADCLEDLPIAGGTDARTYIGDSIMSRLVVRLRRHLLTALWEREQNERPWDKDDYRQAEADSLNDAAAAR